MPYSLWTRRFLLHKLLRHSKRLRPDCSSAVRPFVENLVPSSRNGMDCYLGWYRGKLRWGDVNSLAG